MTAILALAATVEHRAPPEPGDVEVWMRLVGDLDGDVAYQCAVAFYREERPPLSPHALVERARHVAEQRDWAGLPPAGGKDAAVILGNPPRPAPVPAAELDGRRR